jgi:hypothetical protein
MQTSLACPPAACQSHCKTATLPNVTRPNPALARSGKPHCFSSSAERFEDDDLFNADSGGAEEWLVPPFIFDKPLAEALADVRATVQAYPPGQRGIDGGGFRVVKDAVEGGVAYVYVQYESLRKGYVDDFELLLRDGRAEVRTSSRLGYLDMGVNAKR